MLDTKRQRGTVLVVILIMLMVVGLVLGVTRSRAQERDLEAFANRAAAAFDGTDADDVEALVLDSVSDPEGNAALIAFMSQPGQTDTFTLEPPYRATYSLDSGWGGSQQVVVEWDESGYTITPE